LTVVVIAAAPAAANHRVVKASVFDNARCVSGCADACCGPPSCADGSCVGCDSCFTPKAKKAKRFRGKRAKSKCRNCSTGCDGCNGGGCSGGCKIQMPPHYAYYPTDHGYYYDRPYNYRHVMRQQEAVTAWGGDPRNPYSNAVFGQQVYGGQGSIQDLPAELGPPASAPLEPATTPTAFPFGTPAPQIPAPVLDKDSGPLPIPPQPIAAGRLQQNQIRIIPVSAAR
jgi:hypothetical protein